MNPNSCFLPDANVLLGALNHSVPHHAACRDWLARTTAHGAVLLVNDLTECALLRISTLPRLAYAPVEIVLAFHQSLHEYPHIRHCAPGGGHWKILHRLVEDLGLVGNDINDAWLAALSLEHCATLVSMDLGFARFPGLRWHNPASTS